MNEKLITAKQARKISGLTAEEQVELVCEQIQKAAEEKKREIHLHGEFWAHGGYNLTDDYKCATKILKDLGYEVKFHYEERQFVDMYTVVKW